MLSDYDLLTDKYLE